jgi:hypothetical protein
VLAQPVLTSAAACRRGRRGWRAWNAGLARRGAGTLAVDVLKQKRLTANEMSKQMKAPRLETAKRLIAVPGICGPKARTAAFTLAEVVMSVGIMMLVFGAIITAYIQGSYRAEWTGLSLAAQAAGVQQLESAKAAVWDPLQNPVMDQICLLTNVTTVLLDLPVTSSNTVYATNYTTVTLLTNSVLYPTYSNYFVQVQTVWPFRWKNQTVYFTNTLAGYYAPE